MRWEGEILLWWINIYLWKKITAHACVFLCMCVWPTTERPTWRRRPTAGGWKSEAARGQRRNEPADGAPPGRSLTNRQISLTIHDWWDEDNFAATQKEKDRGREGAEREGEMSVLAVMRRGGEFLKIPSHSFCMSWITFPLGVACSFRNTADEDIVCVR